MRKIIASSLLAIVAASGAHAATIIFDLDFAAQIDRGFNKTPVNWVVTQGAVDVDAYCGIICVDLDGSYQTVPAILSTALSYALTTDAKYTLALTIPTGTAHDGMALSFGDLEVYRNPTTPFGLLSVDFTLAAALNAPLTITMLDRPNNLGPYLSRVTLTADALDVAPVPLPAAGWLVLAGLGAIGLARRRRA